MKNKIKKILVATTTYNEVDSVPSFVNKVHHAYPAADILVIDDNSPDGTGPMLESLKKEYPRLIHVSRPRKLGIGSAHLLILQYARDKEYDALITLDADLSHDPSDIPTFVELLKNHEFVIGSRYINGGRCDYGIMRQSLSRCANSFTRAVLRLKPKECTTSFRGFSRDLLMKLPLRSFHSSEYGFFVETVFWTTNVGVRIAEFPIHFQDRRYGQTKISKEAIFKAFYLVLKLFLLKQRNQIQKRLEISQRSIETTPCALCGSNNHTEIYPESGAEKEIFADAVACTTGHHTSHGRIAKCLNCGSVANNPMPSAAELMSAYEEVEDETYLSNLAFRRLTFRYNFSRIRNILPQSGRLIDMGCYCGGFIQVAKEMSYDVVGVEPSKWASQVAREQSGAQIYTGVLKDVPRSEQFDLVTAFDVLEHLNDPIEELLEVNSRLPTGGFFVFSTLDYDNWYSQLLGESWPWLMSMHLHYFNKPTILEITKQTGFRVVGILPYCHIISFEYFLSKLDSIFSSTIFGKTSRILPRKVLDVKLPFRFGDIKLYACIKIADQTETSHL